jgi:NAD-dependent deacetylase
VATPAAFARDPDFVHEFYNMRRRGLLDPGIQPNAAHVALARLEREWAGPVTLVTQNIDDLHERAGSAGPIHIHGEVLKAFCRFCHARTSRKIECRTDLSSSHACSDCGQSGGLRPDIVWFGEMPYHMEAITAELRDCDVFIAIGTSGHVYPAAGFVQEALLAGAYTIEMNLEPSLNSRVFQKSLIGPASVTVPQLVETLLKKS